MNLETRIAEHYGRLDLYERIVKALEVQGVALDNVTADDLKPVDEFHIGGVIATKELLAQLDMVSGMEVLDIGSGIGGSSRLIAMATDCRMTGIDLTPEYVETARRLSDLVGLAERTRFHVGSALDIRLPDAAFDMALMLHVGMNLPDKARLMAEVARVLRPGAIFAIYDIMRLGELDLEFPLPWAELAENSFVEPLDVYCDCADRVGFKVLGSRERGEFALEFFAKMLANIAASGPSPLGLHILMGENTPLKIGNMVAGIKAGRIAPTELILQKPETG